jgi:tRNA pseudouridine38-40 synthase
MPVELAMSDSPRRGVCLKVAYDGSAYCGFQLQKDQPTVQGELERVAETMTGHPVRVRCAGRTDSGVHALGQVAAFASERHISTRGFRLGLNQRLPDDIRVQDVWEVAPDYDPRFDALGKLYRYVIALGELQNPLIRKVTWQLGKRSLLDVAAMREAARALEGTHDYRAFRQADDERLNTVRTLSRVEVIENYQNDPTLLAVEVRGNAFMKNMVRIIAGTLVDVGRGQLAASDVPRMLGANAHRKTAGQTAPAHGLTLVEVYLGRMKLARTVYEAARREAEGAGEDDE